MESTLLKEIRFLKAYAVLSTLLFIVLGTVAFRQAKQRPKFEEIDVERINIVERDGKLKLTISNKERSPDPYINGKSYKLRSGGNAAGMIFYNDQGDECGGLAYGGQTVNGKREAGAGLLFDQLDQDQTIGIQYAENNGRRSAGLTVWDRPDTSLSELIKRIDDWKQTKDGPEKVAAMKKLEEAQKNGEFGATRVIVGKENDKTAMLMLADPKGHPRIKLSVDAAGTPRLEFMDETGKVFYSMPQPAPTAAPR